MKTQRTTMKTVRIDLLCEKCGWTLVFCEIVGSELARNHMYKCERCDNDVIYKARNSYDIYPKIGYEPSQGLRDILPDCEDSEECKDYQKLKVGEYRICMGCSGLRPDEEEVVCPKCGGNPTRIKNRRFVRCGACQGMGKIMRAKTDA